MPIDMAVKNPWSRIIGRETEGNVVRWATNAHDIPSNRVHIIVGIAARNTDDVEVMPVKMHRVLHGIASALIEFIKRKKE